MDIPGQQHEIRCTRCNVLVDKYYKVSVGGDWFKHDHLDICRRCREALMVWVKGKKTSPGERTLTYRDKNVVAQGQGWKCTDCRSPLEVRCFHVHHINGDKADNSPANLKALCPNCHSKYPNKSFDDGD